MVVVIINMMDIRCLALELHPGEETRLNVVTK